MKNTAVGWNFCLGTRIPRHSAGGRGLLHVRTWYISFAMRMCKCWKQRTLSLLLAV